MKLYVIKDVVVGKFNNNAITQLHNDREAERALKQMAVNIKENDISAPDVQLWCIGEFDTDTGLINNNKPYLIGNLIDYIEVRKEE